MNYKMLFIIVLILCISSVAAQTSKSRGVPAYPYFQDLKQPDGECIRLKFCGDRVLNWMETIDGAKILINKDKWFTYATINNKGFMVPSSFIVGRESSKASRGYASAKSNAQKIFFSSQQIKEKERNYFGNSMYNQMRVKGQNSFFKQNTSFPTIGVKKGLMILAEFSDLPHVISASIFNDIMNKENYNGTGSFRDFYLENSYNQFDCVTDIVKNGDNTYVWVTLPNTMKYYGENGGIYDQDLRPEEMVADACRAVKALGLDFSEYDNDKDGYVDNVMIIHSGYGEEARASSDAIWSHRWSISELEIQNGVKIKDYITFPELNGSSGNNSTNIGVLVHEFGHALGLPDYYDTDYEGSGGNSYGLGDWDVMSGGSWNNHGITPAQHNAYSKYILGWIDLPILNSNLSSRQREVILKDISLNMIGGACMIRSKWEKEFFVIENRQQRGFNSMIPSHGMLVYHVDRNYDLGSRGDSWFNNTMNNDPKHQAMELLFAGSSTADNSIPFPGESRKTELSDYTGENYSVVSVKKSHDPTLVNWDLSKSGSSLTNIREEGGYIKFDYLPTSVVNLNLSVVFKLDGFLLSNIDYNGDRF